VCGGTIEKLDGNTLVIKSLDGTRLDMKLADNAVIIGVAKASLADIRQGSYISSGAVPQPDGTQSAGMEKIPEFIAGVRLLLSGIIIATIFYLYSDAKLDQFFFICVGLIEIASRVLVGAAKLAAKVAFRAWAWLTLTFAKFPGIQKRIGRSGTGWSRDQPLAEAQPQKFAQVRFALELLIAVALGC
jgi:hypothetical protein